MRWCLAILAVLGVCASALAEAPSPAAPAAPAAEFKSAEARKAAADYEVAQRAAKTAFLQNLAKARQAVERRKTQATEAVLRDALQQELDRLSAELVRLRDAVQARSAPEKTRTVTVPANVPWTPAGQVVRGATIHFRASGKWKPFAQFFGPEGKGGKEFYLRGRIGTEVFKIGAEATIVALAGGLLEMGMADDKVSDNSGELTVEITITPPAPAAGLFKSAEAIKACADHEAAVAAATTQYAADLAKAKAALQARIAAAPDKIARDAFQQEIGLIEAEVVRVSAAIKP